MQSESTASKIHDSHIAWLFWVESREGVVLEDHDGVILAANPAFARMLGYSPVELVGKSWDSITVSSDIPVSNHIASDIRTGNMATSETSREYRHKSGMSVRASTKIIKCPTGVAEELGLAYDTVLIWTSTLSEAPQIVQTVSEAQEDEIIYKHLGRFATKNWHKIVAALAALIASSKLDSILGKLL